MASEFSITLLAVLVPLALWLLNRTSRVPYSIFQVLAVLCIGWEAGTILYMHAAFETTPIAIYLSATVIFSTFCVIVGQWDSKRSSTVLDAPLVVLGLSLAALLGPAPVNRYGLIGLLGYAAFSLSRSNLSATRRTIGLAQSALAVVLVCVTIWAGDSLYGPAGLFLAVTLVPLPPFHVLFASLVGSARGILSGVWTVAFLSLGLAEIHNLQTVIPMETDIHVAIGFLALLGGLYAALKCLGQNQIQGLLTYATIVQVALLWGLTTIFSSFSEWGIPFGITIGLVMNGLFVAYAFVRQRYGSHAIGNLPGLASPMPRLGTLVSLLISIAVLLPIIPLFGGITTMPATENQGGSFVIISLLFLGAWMFGSWHFSHLLHHTLFGKARPDVPYTDLKVAEICSLVLIIFGASVSILVN
ncbi:MAG: proton-conducting transporter membrane subunit [Nitrospira sp.]|nr:proton-conducting transporter membrane subunit [Nitrospira sp.]MDE0405112.1 proton-conducting transporter membrane subunit [Nitrospira sp.]MDE0486302.1 proton-conducting transporter membrane subunit [Nitrospira sp.]